MTEKQESMHQHATVVPRYICPRTGAVLRATGATLQADDGTTYPVDGAIPQFLCFKAAEDEATLIQLQTLNRRAREAGWEAAIADVFGADPSMIRYITDSTRAGFIDLLPLTPQSRVLEIGPGLGQFTPLLARRAGCVCALEIVAGQAEFAAQRCAQQGMVNVHFAVGGDDCRLPYEPGTFDLVVLNLVFEWCAGRCTDEAAADVQGRLLGEISKVLKPGGSLYLTTKNRFALRYLVGKRDEHCHDIRFGSALPRWLAGFVMRRSGHARAQGLLHSHNALKAMLQQSGFDKVDSFWAAPEMRYPTHYVPTHTKAIREAWRQPGFVQGESRSSRLLMRFVPAGLVKHFTPGLTFIATKCRPQA